jgi:uncharacterized protein (TIGR01777 family)
MSQRIILAGGGGFLGTLLAKKFVADGCEVIVLTRSPKTRSDGAKEIFWDAKTLSDWTRLVDGADVVFNLTGKSVDCRYDEKNRREIIASRVDSTHAIGEAIARAKSPPRIWLNASSATIYKHSFGKPHDEFGETGATPEAKDEFSSEVIRRWERALDEAQTPATRKVAMRISIVFGKNGGAFPVFRRLAKLGLAGAMGDGRQIFSWLHADDFVRAVEWIIARDNLSGEVNLVAPEPVSNREFMRQLRRACGMPIGLPAKKWMLEIGAFFLRTETELLIKSRNVAPGKLLASGFQFKFPKLQDALKDLCR